MKGPDPVKIEHMFDSIAAGYDRLNHLMSLGIDKVWRRRALKLIVTPDSPQTILDVACGTGDFSILIAEAAHPDSKIYAADLSEGMLEVMRQKLMGKGLDGRIRPVRCNCEQLPFTEGCFDRVTIAFGIRNFEHRETALKEFLRVLKPGGKLMVLELSVPSNRLLRWCYNIYFKNITPLIGGLVSGDKAAYRYLPASVHNFPSPREFCCMMEEAGFRDVRCRTFTLGLCRMFTGAK